MIFYIARRLVWTAVVVATVMLITFVVFYLLPAGDPAVVVALADGTFAAEAEPLADIRTLSEYAEHRRKLSE